MNLPRIVWILTLATLLPCISGANPLSEQDAVTLALARNTTIRVYRIERLLDSLAQRKARSEYLPRVNASISPYLIPLDSTRGAGTSGSRKTGSGIEGMLEITQILPGGGTLSLTADKESFSASDAATTEHTTGYGLTLSQPLLRGAFMHAEVDYTIAIAGINSERTILEQKKGYIDEISRVRGAYWTLYERQVLYRIAYNDLEYTRKQREVARRQFDLGAVPAIDTLNAYLEELKAQQNVISAQTYLTTARNTLADLLLFSSDSLMIPESLDVVVEQLPAEEELLRKSRTLHPGLNILSLLKEQLQLQYEHERNKLLPSVALNGSVIGQKEGDSFFGDNYSRRDNLVVSLVLSYQLPTAKRIIDATITQKNMEKNHLDSLQQEQMLVNQLALLRQNWKQELLKLELADAARRVAQQQFEATQAGYALGTVDNLSLLKSRNDLITAQTSFLQNQVTMKQLSIDLEQITGDVLRRFGVFVQE